MKKILITTGGTGGHIIPAEIIEEHLKNIFEIHYSIDLRGLKFITKHKNDVVILNTPRLNFNLLFPFKILRTILLIIKSVNYLIIKKIDKVISIGGYMSLPMIIAAVILKKEIFLFEPNLILGRGNKFFLNFAKKIFCYSDQLENFPKKHIHKIEVIYPLVFKKFYEIKKNDQTNKKFCFLISGGSQGAKIFNSEIKEVMKNLSKKYSIKVIHQTNENNINDLTNYYKSNNIEHEIFSFDKNFMNLINKSDFCITRAGATSLAEISIMNKPFLAIPLPSAQDDHQTKNAKYYQKLGCCWIIDQKNFNREKLFNILLNIINNEEDFMKKKSNLKKLNFQNSWNDVNHKLKEIINEN